MESARGPGRPASAVDTEGRWADYLRTISNADTQSGIAAQTGVNQANVSRWFRQHHIPSAIHVIQVARGYGVSPVEALVAASYLTPDEAGPLDLSRMSTAVLLAEVKRRTGAAPTTQRVTA